MTCIRDPNGILKRELARLHDEFDLPGDFPPEVLENANQAASQRPDAKSHRDRTGSPFVTLDPANSTDLDQAFHIERSGTDIILHYAIADVSWFVDYDTDNADQRRPLTNEEIIGTAGQGLNARRRKPDDIRRRNGLRADPPRHRAVHELSSALRQGEWERFPVRRPRAAGSLW